MSDLLLTHGYFLYEDPKEMQILKPYVSLGHPVHLLAPSARRVSTWRCLTRHFPARRRSASTCKRKQPSILGIYANLMTRKRVVEILRIARLAGWKTVVGGPEPGAYINEYLEAGADAVVLGEGEVTMEELLPALRSDSLSNLRNVFGNCILR